MRIRPATVIAFLALLGAWGGPAVAAHLITSRDIKDRSIQGRDLKSNTITGRVVKGLSARDIKPDALDGTVIDESSLDQVPDAARAAVADNAGHAATADALTGSHPVRIAYARTVNADTTTVFDEGGLRLQARCTGSGLLAVAAVASNSTGGLVHIAATAPGSSGAQVDNDLRPGDVVNALPAGADGATGTVTFFNPAGDTVTVSYLAQQALPAARGFQCVFAGTAVHGTP